MQTKKLICTLMAALMLLCLVPARAAAKTFDEDWSDLAFTMRDVPSDSTVAYDGACGVPTVLLFGDIAHCQNTQSFIANLLALNKLLEPGALQAFLFDVRGASDETITYVFSDVRIPQGFYVGIEETMAPDTAIFRMLELFNGPGNYSYTLPFVAYIDAAGTVKEITAGSVSKQNIQTALTRIGMASQRKDSADILISGEFRQTEARQELAMVNALRTGDAWYWNADNKTKTVKKDLQPLVYDYDLEKVAMQRAVELALRYDHTRPDGSRCFDAYSELGYEYGAAGENIAYGYRTAEAVQTAWEEKDDGYEGQGHRRNMLDDSFAAFGSACFVYNGVCFWAQEFSGRVNSAAAVPAKDGAAVGTVRLPASVIAGWSASTDSLELRAGKTVSITDLVTLYLHTDNSRYETREAPKWKTSDASILRVNADGTVTALAAGRAMLTATMPSRDGDRPVAVVITVQGDAPVPSRLPGDVDANGRLEAADARLALRAAVGLESFAQGSDDFRAADADRNNELTAADARMILRAAVGLEDLPA